MVGCRVILIRSSGIGIDPVLLHCLTSALAFADHGRRGLEVEQDVDGLFSGEGWTSNSSCDGVS